MAGEFSVQFLESGGTKHALIVKAWDPMNMISVDRSAYPDRFLHCLQNVVCVDENPVSYDCTLFYRQSTVTKSSDTYTLLSASTELPEM